MQVGGRAKKESEGRDILIEVAIIGLARNPAVWKFPGISPDDPG